jgi:hypothetical protein
VGVSAPAPRVLHPALQSKANGHSNRVTHKMTLLPTALIHIYKTKMVGIVELLACNQ